MKYRILTNGDKFKVQIKSFLFWLPLQKNIKGIPVIMRDIIYDDYWDARSAAIGFIKAVEKKGKWRVCDYLGGT